jgi:hypothetical protein
MSKKRALLLIVAAVMAVLPLSFVNVAPVLAAGSCDGVQFLDSNNAIVQPYVAGRFKVVINSPRDGAGVLLTSGTAQIFVSRYNHDGTANGVTFAELNATYASGKWTSTLSTPNVPTRQGEIIYVTFRHSNESGDVCQKSASTERNPNGIPSLGEQGANDFCCNPDTGPLDQDECGDYRGRSSTCSGDNGACASGAACVGGSIVGLNNSCDPSRQENACRGVVNGGISCVGTNAICTASCTKLAAEGANLADCLATRYGIDYTTLASSMPEGCQSDPTLLVKAMESQFGEGISPNNCPVGAINCTAYIGGAPPSTDALLCFAAGQCDPGSPVQCSINASYSNGTVNATITSLCMPPGQTYSLVMNTGSVNDAGQEIFARDFAGITSGNQISISVPVTNPPDATGAVTFRVFDENTVSPICFEPFNNFFASSDNEDEEDSNQNTDSTDFGIQNCPYPDPAGARPAGVPDYAWDLYRAGVDVRTGEQVQEHGQCVSCITAGRTWTALGCIDTSVAGIFTSLVRIALGVMGGVVLLRLIYLGYIYQTGDTKKIAEARSGIISTIAGIIVVIFSVVILRIIGVNILDIVPPGFFGTS